MDGGGALRQLLAFFKIDVDSSELAKADKKVDGFIGKLKVAATAIGEALAVREVSEFFAEQVENAAHLQDLAEKLDVSTDAIRAFGFAAKESGVDVDSAAMALSYLQRSVGMAILGGTEQTAAFQALDVSLKDAAGHARPLQEVVEDVADGMQRLPDQSARATYAMTIFGRQGMALLPVLAKGKDALRELFGEQKKLDSELGGDFPKKAKEARSQWEYLGASIQALKEQGLAVTLPALTALGRALTEGVHGLVEMNKHTKILQMGMIGLAVGGALKLAAAVRSLASDWGMSVRGMIASLKALEREEIIATLGVAAVAAAIVDMTSDESKIQGLVDRMWDFVTGAKEGAKNVHGMQEAVSSFLELLEDTGKDILRDIIIPLEQAWDVAKGFARVLGALMSGGSVKDAAQATHDEMVGDFDNRKKQMENETQRDVFGATSDQRDRQSDDLETTPEERTRKSWDDHLKAIRGEGSSVATMTAEQLLDKVGLAKRSKGLTMAPISWASMHGRSESSQAMQTVNFGDINITSSDDPDAVAKAGREAIREASKKLDNANTLASRNVP